MPFQRLKRTSALELESCDIDHFRETERYAGASSIPLSTGTTAIVRARLGLPALTLSLVKTFPRVIRGYQLTNAAAIVVPMDQVTSARINGQAIGHSVLILKGHSDCLVYEPEGRLVAVIYFRPAKKGPWTELTDGYHLLNPASDELVSLRRVIATALDTAANDPGLLADPIARALIEQSVLSTMEAAVRADTNGAPARSATAAYRRIVADMEEVIQHDPTVLHKATELAQQTGVSVRTLQNATQAICGMSPHRYAQMLRLWAVRQQFRTGSAGLSVKACAMSHGFWHMGDFAATYKAAFGELPSQTLHRAMRGG